MVLVWEAVMLEVVLHLVMSGDKNIMGNYICLMLLISDQ